ncbi:MAG TPA: SAM-dependent chlorinase/fluorinase [Pyrinomonadaceae bacterium]
MRNRRITSEQKRRDRSAESWREEIESTDSAQPPSHVPLITLLTDFGTTDYFVGAMKGAILNVNPEARIIDITHEIPPHDIRAAAFTLYHSYKTFPPKTIHVAVVDPGVGSMRRPLLVRAGEHFFIGPDNGLFSYIFYFYDVSVDVFELSREEYFRQPVSATFHGRDIFAPVAGALSKGVFPEELGTEVYDDYIRLDLDFYPMMNKDGALEGSIIHIDHFGNCITNLSHRDFAEEMAGRWEKIVINGHEIKSFRQFYAQHNVDSDELFAIWGSARFLEIVAYQDSASRRLNARRGQKFIVVERE